jgi:hypothetical protein
LFKEEDMGTYNPGVTKFNQYRQTHGEEVCPGAGACAVHTTVETFEWPEDTGMDGRDQNLDGVVRDPDVVAVPVVLWPRGQAAGGMAAQEVVVMSEVL